MRVETEERLSLIINIFLKNTIKVFKVGSWYDEFSYQFNVKFGSFECVS
jgi:hypothetical protein